MADQYGPQQGGFPPQQQQPGGFPPQSGGFPPPPGDQPYGYPPAQAVGTPGQVVTASVLSYVQGGLVLLAAVSLFALRDLAESFNAPTGMITIMAIVNIVLAGLLIFGGVRLNTGKDRNLLIGANIASLALSIFWAVQGAKLWAVLLFSVMPIVALVMAFAPVVAQWLASRRGR